MISTPERNQLAQLGRADSKHVEKTCHGISRSTGCPCRRSINPKNGLYCRDHRDQKLLGRSLVSSSLTLDVKSDKISSPKTKKSENDSSTQNKPSKITKHDGWTRILLGIIRFCSSTTHDDAVYMPSDSKPVNSNFNRKMNQIVVSTNQLAISKPIQPMPDEYRLEAPGEDGLGVILDLRQWIPPSATLDMQAKLLAEMRKPPSLYEETGYIYIFAYTDGPLKIGRAHNLERRLYQWEAQCGPVPQLIAHYPTSSSMRCRASKKVERLVHLELEHCRIKRPCKCGRLHQEWFLISPDQARALISRWVLFDKTCYGQSPVPGV